MPAQLISLHLLASQPTVSQVNDASWRRVTNQMRIPTMACYHWSLTSAFWAKSASPLQILNLEISPVPRPSDFRRYRPCCTRLAHTIYCRSHFLTARPQRPRLRRSMTCFGRHSGNPTSSSSYNLGSSLCGPNQSRMLQFSPFCPSILAFT